MNLATRDTSPEGGGFLLAVLAATLLLLVGLGLFLLDAADGLHVGRGLSPLGVLPLALGAALERRPGPRTRKTPAPPRRSDAPRLVAALRGLWALPDWALLADVASGLRAFDERLGRADAVAFRTSGTSERWEVHGFEAKVSRADFVRELRHPEKAWRVGRFCGAWSFVTPAPWKRVVLAASELPEGAGLVEVDRGTARVVVPALERAAEDLSIGFLRAVLRASAEQAERLERDDAATRAAPLRAIARRLPSGAAALTCLHVLERPPRPKASADPRVPCVACVAGDPAEPDAIAAALEDAGPEDLARYQAVIARAGGPLPSPVLERMREGVEGIGEGRAA
jgi:hypothetical protein